MLRRTERSEPEGMVQHGNLTLTLVWQYDTRRKACAATFNLVPGLPQTAFLCVASLPATRDLLPVYSEYLRSNVTFGYMPVLPV